MRTVSSPGPLPRSLPRHCWARPAPPWSAASPRKPRATPQNGGLRAGAYPDLTDRLFQYDRVKAPPAGAASAFGRPFEADRTTDRLVAVAATRPLTAEEHQELTGIISSRTGLPIADADDDDHATVVDDNDARTAADTARRVAMRLSFWTVAAMLMGALAGESLAASREGGAIATVVSDDEKEISGG